MTTTTIVLQPGDSITVSAAGTPIPPDPPHPQPIPGVPMTLTLDGEVRDTVGLNTSQMTAVGSFVVPDARGKSSNFKCFEHGTSSIWRWAWLTQDPASIDPTKPMAQGAGGCNLPFSIGTPQFGATTVQPGQVWYVVVRNQKLNGQPSCTSGLSCNYGYSVDIPS